MQNLKEFSVIRDALLEDAPVIAEIYNYYVRETIITFEETPVSPAEIKKRILTAQSSALPWLTAELKDEIVGYAYAGRWRERTAFRFSVELTVYVHPDHHRHGIGCHLYRRLLPALKAEGVHTALGGIALPNNASIGLHEKFGFKKVSHFKEVGFKLNRWIDVGYWQLIL